MIGSKGLTCNNLNYKKWKLQPAMDEKSSHEMRKFLSLEKTIDS